uniref:Cytochrome c oxidase subunit n=1 Tax=Oryza brachyantha TaxID=4533 RepID=J3LPE5_ORYBR
MAAEPKAPSLAEEYSLPPQEAPVEKAVEDKPQEAESIPVTNDETPQPDETETAVEVNSETSEAADKSEAEETNPAAEETTETAEEETEEKPEIKIETAPADFRFPTTNQTRHCFTRYVEYHRCVAAKGEDAPECDKFAKYYRSLCPGEWHFNLFFLPSVLVERWNEQRENGTFPGPL